MWRVQVDDNTPIIDNRVSNDDIDTLGVNIWCLPLVYYTPEMALCEGEEGE